MSCRPRGIAGCVLVFFESLWSSLRYGADPTICFLDVGMDTFLPPSRARQHQTYAHYSQPYRSSSSRNHYKKPFVDAHAHFKKIDDRPIHSGDMSDTYMAIALSSFPAT